MKRTKINKKRPVLAQKMLNWALDLVTFEFVSFEGNPWHQSRLDDLWQLTDGTNRPELEPEIGL